MDEAKMRTAFFGMSAGDKRKEAWFRDRGMTQDELDIAVDLGYLVRYEKDPHDFMSNAGYMLTQKGQDFVWERDPK